MFIDGKSLITDVAYLSNLSVADMRSFNSAFIKYFYPEIKIELKKEIINHKIDEFMKKASETYPMGQNEATMLCLARDLWEIKKVIQKIQLKSVEENLERAMKVSSKCIKEKTGLESKIDYFIVKQFPSPFDNKPFSAMAFDKADREKYGIKEGIYFRKESLLPYRSTLIMLHELIHLIIATREPSKLARGLEDGLCDFLGSLYLGSKIFDLDICFNYLKNRRLAFDFSLLSMRYLKNLQQAALLYILFGFEGLWYLVSKGRSFIELIERNLISGEIKKLKQLIPVKKEKEQNSKIEKFAYSVLAFENTLTVSPLAFFIAENIQEGDYVEDVIRKLRLIEYEAQKALAELTDAATYLMIIKDGKVTCDKSKVYLGANMLRWKLANV